ncbi:MAG TPA: hypothetical protein VFU73_09985 [Actinocrinis sp.]|nr:hypothetical protein [Actinocrinis sp.]
MPDIPADAQRSPDGNYWWDGTQWQLVDNAGNGAGPSADDSSSSSSTSIPADAQRSPDGNYWWDGTQWQPVDNADAGPGAASTAQGQQPLTNDQFSNMLDAAQSGVVEG